jgi:hypothetical protein
VTLSTTFVRRGVQLGAMFVALTFAAACDDDDPTGDDGDDHAEEVASIRLTVGDQTYTIDESGVEPSPITVPVASVPVEADFLDDEGQPVDGLTDDEFELGLEVGDPSLLTYVPTDAFEGTLTGTQAGETTISVSLIHEDHPDFGPFPVPVTVGP